MSSSGLPVSLSVSALNQALIMGEGSLEGPLSNLTSIQLSLTCSCERYSQGPLAICPSFSSLSHSRHLSHPSLSPRRCLLLPFSEATPPPLSRAPPPHSQLKALNLKKHGKLLSIIRKGPFIPTLPFIFSLFFYIFKYVSFSFLFTPRSLPSSIPIYSPADAVPFVLSPMTFLRGIA